MPNQPKQPPLIPLPAEGRTGPIPKPTAELSAKARRMWNAWWRSPMATMWNVEVDVFALTRLAEMYDFAQEVGVSDRVTVEMRQLEATFGLNPKARKDLNWVIVDTDADAAPTGDAPSDEVARLREERRRRLAAS